MTINHPDTDTGFPPTPSHFGLPRWYPELLDSIAGRITTGRQRATARVSAELIMTYWAIGRDILDRQEQEGWGAKVIDRLSADLRERFPDARGYSPRNLKYMRAFAAAWPDPAIVQRSAAQLPWRQHQVLLDKLDRPDQRLWYAAQAIAEGWSRDILALKIDLRLHERKGKAITNFAATMPPEDSDLAQQATKDPYVFDFLDLDRTQPRARAGSWPGRPYRQVPAGTRPGFAFVGRQVRLEVEGDEFFCDLLFYHLKLRRYVVIELKAVRLRARVPRPARHVHGRGRRPARPSGRRANHRTVALQGEEQRGRGVGIARLQHTHRCRRLDHRDHHRAARRPGVEPAQHRGDRGRAVRPTHRQRRREHHGLNKQGGEQP